MNLIAGLKAMIVGIFVSVISSGVSSPPVLPSAKISVKPAKNDVPARIVEITPMGQEEVDKIMLKKQPANTVSRKTSSIAELDIE